ncbi:trehalose operon repressor [Lacticaseibacillus daqingensis]|uniref:trehalose operon repressor n=1 Tax=Lacticaseibacillus daqingensis TaxID=2486014 RepID=UPI000F76A3E0|nr:trehalose operon repressor [Lacticaseibacillus daqingensis]
MTVKHVAIYSDLLRKISRHVYAAGSYLPSEQDLMALYGTSRDTVRKALSALLEDGYIHKIKGKGSLVLETDRYSFPIASLTSYQELDDIFDMKSHTQVLALESAVVPTREFNLADKVCLAATKVERLRYVEGVPLIIDRDYVLKDIVPTVPRAAAENSLFAYFEDELGLSVSYANKELTVAKANQDEADALEMKLGDPIVIIRSITHLQSNQVVSYTTSVHRGDKFRFTEHAMRRKV